MAHEARWAILVTRTDPDVPKHRGMTYFVCDMTAPGVEVRPLRQITGEAEFNEVFLTDVRIPDEHRLGEVGQGWQVSTTTLMNERVAIGGNAAPRESGMVGVVAALWRDRPELRTPGLHDALLRAWVETEAARLTGARLRQQLTAGQPGPEGSGAKLAFAKLNQEVSGLELEMLGEDGLRYDDWTMRRPTEVDFTRRSPGYRYLRARATPSRAAPRRSCATSSPSASSACPARSASTRTCPGRTCPSERPAVLGDRERPAVSVRELLDDKAPWTSVLVGTEKDEPYDAALWRAVAGQLGCAGLPVPEDLGGVRHLAGDRRGHGGAGPVRRAPPVPDQLGRRDRCAAGRWGARPARGAGRGEKIAVLAVPFSAGPGDVSSAVQAADGTLTGEVTSVADGMAADVFLVPASDGLYAVDAADARRTAVTSLDMTRRLADIAFSGAPARRVAEGTDAVRAALLTGAAMLASEQLGLAERCLDDTVAYVKTRYQFGTGRLLPGAQAPPRRSVDVDHAGPCCGPARGVLRRRR